MTRTQLIQAINGDYQQLLAVFNKYKINKKFDAFFAQVQTADANDMHYKMLHRHVKEIFRKLEQNNGFEADVVASVVKEEKKPEIEIRRLDIPADKIKQRIIIDSNPHVNREELPEDLKILYDENGKLSGEMKSKHAMLKVETLADKRKSLIGELTTMEDSINANWSKIDKWYEDSKAEAKAEPEKTLDPVETAKRIEAAKRYIDRYFNSKKPKTIAEVNERTKYLKSLGIDYIARPLRKNYREGK